MYLESIASGSSFDPTCSLKSPPIYVRVRIPAPVTVQLNLGVHLLHLFVFVSRVESRPRMLRVLDVFGPPHVDEYCRFVACFAVSCCCEVVSLLKATAGLWLVMDTCREKNSRKENGPSTDRVRPHKPEELVVTLGKAPKWTGDILFCFVKAMFQHAASGGWLQR